MEEALTRTIAMRKHARIVTPVLSLCLVAAVAAGMWVLSRDPFRQTHRLPNGRRVTLEAVTYGTQHQVLHGAWWQRLLAFLPPVREQLLLLDDRPTAQDALVFWYSRDRAAGDPQDPWKMGSLITGSTRLPEVLDEHEYTLGRAGFGHPSWTGRGSRLLVESVALQNFPRRGRTVRLRFVDDSGKTLLEFSGANPKPGPYPTWTAEPYPIVRRKGDLSFALTGLVTGADGQSPYTAARPGQPWWTNVQFRITESGRLSRSWEPVEAAIEDATGNAIDRAFGKLAHKGDDIYYWCAGLSPDESAWKLRVEFSENARAPTARGTTWTMRGVPVPQQDQVIRSMAEGRIGPGVIRLVGAAGAGHVSWGGEQHAAHWAQPVVRARVTGLRKGQRVTLLCRDEQGRVFAGYDSTPGGAVPSRDGSVRYYLNIPPGARRMDLTFAVRDSHVFEYLAKPSRAGFTAAAAR